MREGEESMDTSTAAEEWVFAHESQGQVVPQVMSITELNRRSALLSRGCHNRTDSSLGTYSPPFRYALVQTLADVYSLKAGNYRTKGPSR